MSAPEDWYAGGAFDNNRKAKHLQWLGNLPKNIEGDKRIQDAGVGRKLTEGEDPGPPGKPKPLVFISPVDCLVGAHYLSEQSHKDTPNEEIRIAVVSFACPDNLGGKFKDGSDSQEASILVRTSLWYTLKEADYPLENDALIYSKDVFVASLYPGILRKWEDRFYVDIISCAALDSPKLKHDVRWTDLKPPIMGDDFADEEDHQIMTNKIRLIMRAAVRGKATHVVLGAFGCGYAKNPPHAVAALMKKVLIDDLVQEDWRLAGIKRVMIAIKDFDTTGRTNMPAFENRFEGCPLARIDWFGTDYTNIMFGTSDDESDEDHA